MIVKCAHCGHSEIYDADTGNCVQCNRPFVDRSAYDPAPLWRALRFVAGAFGVALFVIWALTSGLP